MKRSHALRTALNDGVRNSGHGAFLFRRKILEIFGSDAPPSFLVCILCTGRRCKAKLLPRWWYQWALVAPLANPVSVYTLNKCTQHRYDETTTPRFVPANGFWCMPNIFGCVSVCALLFVCWARCPTSDYHVSFRSRDLSIDFSANCDIHGVNQIRLI